MRTLTSFVVSTALVCVGNTHGWMDGGALDARKGDTPVLAASNELVAAVRARDVQRLLHLVASDGVPCVDANVSREEVERQLRTRGSWLNAYFFEPEVFKQKFADPFTPISF